MKTFILLALLVIVSAVSATQEGHLMIRLKSLSDSPKLALLSLIKSNDISEFVPLVDPSKSVSSGMSKSASFQKLQRYYEVVPSVEFQKNLKTGVVALEKLQKDLLRTQGDLIDACYISPLSELPVIRVIKTSRQSKKSDTPLFVDRQFYLNESPNGVGQKHTINRGGGDGKDIQVVDIEGGWDLDHEDFAEKPPKLIHGVQARDSGWTNHGTAVLGEIAGNKNSFGVNGIAPKTTTFGASIYDTPTRQGLASRAMIAAAAHLRKGDIMLIELQRGGPTGRFIAMEWWPDNFDALKAATEKGVIVIEAAGNGNQDLDDPRLNRPQAGFPRDWKNPFNRSLADCGAILVGATAPPSQRWGPHHSRLDFSNYGTSLDVSGYGRDVCTTGYGDLQRGPRQKLYTNQFSGTSSASPIVVGAIVALQGVSKSEYSYTLTPADVRALVRKTGVPQRAHPSRPTSQRIGSFPNLRELVAELKSLIKRK